MSNDTAPADPGNAITPLPGEPGIPDVARRPRPRLDWRGILAVTMAVLSLIAVAAMAVNRALTRGNPDASEHRRSGERPSAATAEPRKLDMPEAPPQRSASPASTAHVVPAIVATPDDSPAEPIGVRRNGSANAGTTKKPRFSPEDAPVMLVTGKPGHPTQTKAPLAEDSQDEPRGAAQDIDTLEGARRNLRSYQRQLNGLLETMNRTATASSLASPTSSPAPPPQSGLGSQTSQASPAALFGGQLQGSSTPRTSASTLGNRSLTLPKGTAFTCVLKTRVVSAVSGFVGCQTQRNVYGDDGRVLLIERGSHLDGEYRIAFVKPGMVRIPVLWTRIRTPHGVTVDIASPGTGALGEAGIDGYVDNRWGERIGAAMLLSLIDDSVKLVVQNQVDSSNAGTIVLTSTADNTSKLAEKVLDSTINIPPLIYQNQGGIIGIYVARDVDFSSVYELKPTASVPPREGTP